MADICFVTTWKFARNGPVFATDNQGRTFVMTEPDLPHNISGLDDEEVEHGEGWKRVPAYDHPVVKVEKIGQQVSGGLLMEDVEETPSDDGPTRQELESRVMTLVEHVRDHEDIDPSDEEALVERFEEIADEIGERTS